MHWKHFRLSVGRSRLSPSSQIQYFVRLSILILIMPLSFTTRKDQLLDSDVQVRTMLHPSLFGPTAVTALAFPVTFLTHYQHTCIIHPWLKKVEELIGAYALLP
jgi:hypothetical protein